MACETGCGQAPQFDCVTELKSLFKAYCELSRGDRRIEVEHTDPARQSRIKYNKADLPGIASLYNQLYKQCGGATNLPAVLVVDPSTQTSTKRGRSALAFFA